MATPGIRQQALKAEIFKLALFLHSNVTEAQAVTINALEKFDKAADLQYRRTNNSKKEKSYRADFSDQQLAQQMVYEASEQFLANAAEIRAFSEPALMLPGVGAQSERHLAGVAVANAQTLENEIIHFLKFLVLITTRRNALYVAVGFCQLLRAFSTDDAALILETLKTDDQHTWLESQCRNIKSKLMKELLERFALQTKTGAHGSTNFVPLPDADRYHSLVLDCLSHFVPWETSHVNQNLSPLPSEIEIFHALLEPECFSTVLAALRMHDSEHFALPKLTGISQKGGGGSPLSPTSAPGPNGPPVTGMMKQQNDDPHLILEQIEEELRQRAAARAALKPETVRIFVNGKFSTILDLQAQTEVALEIEESDRLIEVYAPSANGEILLASLPIACDADGGIAPMTATTRKNAGLQFSFAISPTNANATEPINTRANVTVKYRQPWLRRLGQQLGSLFSSRRVWRPSLAFVSLSLIAALLWNLVKVPATAADLVQKSIATEKATLENDFKAGRIPVRRVRLEESRPGDSKPKTYYISTWNDAQRSARLLSRDEARKEALSGEWQLTSGVPSLRYQREVARNRARASQTTPNEFVWATVKAAAVNTTIARTPLSQSALTTTGVEIWQLSPDAADFQALIGTSDAAVAKETPEGWELHYVAPSQTEQRVRVAFLKLDRNYHAVAMHVTLKVGEETHEFRFTEETWEKKPVQDVEQKIFTPRADMIEQVAPVNPQANPSATPTQQTAATVPTVTLAEEIDIRDKLDQIGASKGQEVRVARTPDNKIEIRALDVKSEERKAEILRVLAPYQNHSAVIIRVYTREETLKSKSGENAAGAESDSSKETRALAHGLMDTAERLQNFYVGKGKSLNDLERLSPESRKTLLDKARALSSQYLGQVPELQKALGGDLPVAIVPREITDWAQLQSAVRELYDLSRQIYRAASDTSADEPNQSKNGEAMKRLGQARSLAQKIRQAAEKMN